MGACNSVIRLDAHKFPCLREWFPNYRFSIARARPSCGCAVPNVRATPRVAQDVPTPTDVRYAEAVVRDAYPKRPPTQFPVVHAPHDEIRQGRRRVEQVRPAPEPLIVVHEVHSHDDVGLPTPIDAANRVEQLQNFQL